MGVDTGNFTRVPIRPAVATKHAEHFYRRVPATKPTYEADAGDLMPKPVKKVGSLSVELADAEKVRVKTEGATVRHYEAGERPTLRFKGKLAIEDIAETDIIPEAYQEEYRFTAGDSTFPGAEAAAEEVEEETAEVVRVAVMPTEEPVSDVSEEEVQVDDEEDEAGEPVKLSRGGIEVEHLKGRGRMHKVSAAKAKSLPILHNPDGVIGMQRARVSDRNPTSGTLKVSAPVVTNKGIPSPVIISVVALASLVLAVVIIGFEGQVSTEAGSVVEAYSFTLKEIVELFKTRVTALLVHSFGQ